MATHTMNRGWAMGGCALLALSYASGALAQAGGQLEEVVVTATRQNDTVNRVPLSVTAETQKNLDQLGIRTITDLVGIVPALTLTQTSPGVANVAIRGIQNGGATNTAPTTGFYLDDTPLQKRNTAGFINGNGTPLPPLFDLDRVEVLRGPQGTLFGGSSEGGTVRYITPQPSLTRYTVYARAEASTTKSGDPSYEGGVAVGGPIIQDKLGFRGSVFAKKTGGYIDYIDPFTGAKKFNNANSGQTRLARLSILWAPTDRSRVTLAFFTSTDKSDSNVSTFTLNNIKTPIVEQPVCFNANTLTPATRSFPPTVACNSPGVTYQRPGGTFGPYNLQPYDLVTPAGRAPSKTLTRIPTLTLDYDFTTMTAKSITSYISDENATYNNSQGNELNQRNGLYTYAGAPPSVAFPGGGAFTKGLPVSYGIAGFGADVGPYFGYADLNNTRRGLTEEIRFASAANAKPFTWVGGVFFSNMRVTTRWRGTSGEAISQGLYGLSTAQRYGVPLLADPDTGLNILYDYQAYKAKDVEVAGFAEGNYWVTEKLKLTAGVRVSHTTFTFHGEIAGPASGVIAPILRDASTDEDPVTPKFGVQYQITDKDMVYATASKGFRTGGVNPNLSPALCNPIMARFGLSTTDVPATYASDSVWSYEAGGKFRMFDNRVQLNGDVYRIDWNNIQAPINFAGCGTQYIVNSGSARSQGFELEAQARLFTGMTANLGLGYTDAKYLNSIFLPAGPGFAPSLTTIAGQKFAVPPWTLNLGARYEVPVSATTKAYARGDWRWTSHYNNTPPVGVPGYSPDVHPGFAVSKVNVRAGVEFGDWDINAFVNNLTNAKDGNIAGGRGGCTAAGGSACTTYSTYNPYLTTSWGTPRQVGIQIAYRH
jgi:iron complex outermembrane receptor protein